MWNGFQTMSTLKTEFESPIGPIYNSVPNTNKEKVLAPNINKEWVIGQQMH